MNPAQNRAVRTRPLTRPAPEACRFATAAIAIAAITGGHALAQHAEHVRQWEREGRTDVHPAHLQTAEPAPPAARQAGGGSDQDPCGVVFGYLPYWTNPSTVDFSRLTHVACFSVGVDSLGNVSNGIGWPWTSTINRARSEDVKVILTVTQFSPSSLFTLLTSPMSRARFIDQLTPLVAGYADGVNIDFEGGTSNGWPAYMPTMLAELRAALEPVVPGIEISVATPAVNWSDRWPLAAVAQQSDHVVIMAYAYNGAWSSITGAEAPFTGGSLNVTNTVLGEYASVLGQSPEKLVLALPLYGQRWETTSSTPRSSVVRHVNTPTYTTGWSDFNALGRSWDASSQTSFVSYWTGSAWRQLWIDDADSTAVKIDFARDRALGGIGFWALGYEGSGAPATEFWNMIDETYIAPCEPNEPGCPADVVYVGSGPHYLSMIDINAFVAWLAQSDERSEWAPPAEDIDFFDLSSYLNDFEAGCDG